MWGFKKEFHFQGKDSMFVGASDESYLELRGLAPLAIIERDCQVS
jgi:hypothetical protein